MTEWLAGLRREHTTGAFADEDANPDPFEQFRLWLSDAHSSGVLQANAMTLSTVDGPVTWLDPPAPGESGLAALVEGLEWPAGDGYFWMAGESAQMRAIRKHLMRERRLPSSAYDVMGYWRGVAQRQPRAVDPGPIWRDGKAAGKSDAQIWAEYDEASQQSGES